MLVHGDEGAEGEGVDRVDHQAVGRPVAGELLVWRDLHDLLRRHAALLELLHHLLPVLALHQGLGLGEEVGEEDGVVQGALHGAVVRVHGGDEVAGDDPGALVDED